MVTLIVEDDPDWAALISSAVGRKQDEYAIVDSAAQALRFASIKPADVFIIDVLLPDGSGLELCKQLRSEHPDTPSILISSLDRPTDRVEGLRMGADDYMAKPFHPTELRTRIETISRRYRKPLAAATREDVPLIVSGDLRIDVERPSVHVGEYDAHFTRTEAKLLAQLVRFQGQPLSWEFLAEEMWGYSDAGCRQLIKGYIGPMRRKIREAGGDEDQIRAIRGVGYAYVPTTT